MPNTGARFPVTCVRGIPGGNLGAPSCCGRFNVIDGSALHGMISCIVAMAAATVVVVGIRDCGTQRRDPGLFDGPTPAGESSTSERNERCCGSSCILCRILWSLTTEGRHEPWVRCIQRARRRFHMACMSGSNQKCHQCIHGYSCELGGSQSVEAQECCFGCPRLFGYMQAGVLNAIWAGLCVWEGARTYMWGFFSFENAEL